MSIRLAAALYNLALALLLTLGAPAWIAWVLRDPRVRADFGQRLTPLASSDRPTLWVHAASVGEVEAVAPLIRRLRDRGVRLRLTSLSDTGCARLRELFPDAAPRLAPLDLPGLIGSSLRRARVAGLILVETELWPNLLRGIRRRGGTVLLASARLSDRSYPRYRRLRLFWKPFVADLPAIAARSPRDAERFLALGARKEAVRCLGELKWARPAPGDASAELCAAIGNGPFLLGASTHAGEDEALLDAYAELLGEAPDLRLILAPRHLDRIPEIQALVETRGLAARRRSQGAADAKVVLLDTHGELASLYARVDLVFLGGSLVPVGGHNLIEVIQAGRVVVVGPHTGNQQPQVELLEPTGALLRVADSPQLAAVLRELFEQSDRDAPARHARGLCQEQGRALDRVVDWLDELGALGHAVG